MRTATRTILTSGAILMGVAVAAAQAPEGVRRAVLVTEMPAASGGGRGGSPFAVIERLMSFDVNKDNRISRDELPERMHGLVGRGDRNGNAALDPDEIRALVAAASSERVRISSRTQPPEGLPGVIKDLRLSPEKQEHALSILSRYNLPLTINHNDNATTSDLYRELKALLDDEEYENFVAAATRLSRSPQFRGGTVSGVIGGVVK
jgi:hypothetical protein